MANLFGVIAVVLFVSVCFWNVASVVVLPVLMSAVALFAALKFGHAELSVGKKRNVAAIVLVSIFFVSAVYLSLRFSPDMANGEHFRNYIPFLNVSFR